MRLEDSKIWGELLALAVRQQSVVFGVIVCRVDRERWEVPARTTPVALLPAVDRLMRAAGYRPA